METLGKQLSQVKSKLRILSLNIQTINTKVDELKIILDDINQHHPISVICLQEIFTLHNNTNSLIKVTPCLANFIFHFNHKEVNLVIQYICTE